MSNDVEEQHLKFKDSMANWPLLSMSLPQTDLAVSAALQRQL